MKRLLLTLLASGLSGWLSIEIIQLGLWLLPNRGQALLVPALISFFPLWLGIAASSQVLPGLPSLLWRLGLPTLLGQLILQWLHQPPAINP